MTDDPMIEQLGDIKVFPFDAARYLTDPETEAEFLTAALEADDGDGKTLAAALGVLARKRGMAEMAAAAGVHPKTLYRSLSENGNPSMMTTLRVVRALGLSLAAHPKEETGLAAE